MSRAFFASWKQGGRAIWRLTHFAGGALFAAATFVGQRRHRRDVASRARWLQIACRRALGALGVVSVSTGVPPVNSVIVANHLGYLDILVLAAMAPVVFVAKREVARWPIFGRLARMAGTRFIDRENRADVIRVGAELAGPLAAGVNVVLFLEGTSTDGLSVQRFKSSLLEPVVKHGWTVSPAALAFQVPAGHSAADEVCWWGDMTLAPHLFNLAGISQVHAHVAWGEPVVPSGDRKQLATELHAKVQALHATLRTEGVPTHRSTAPVDFVAMPL